MKEDYPDNSDREAYRIAWLIAGYLRQTLSEKEHDELDEWVTANDDNQRLFEEMIIPANIEKGMKEMKGIDTEGMLKRIKEKIPFNKEQKTTTRKLWVYGIAASILLIAGTFMVFQLFFEKDKPGKEITEAGAIKPGGNKATLTLTNGKIIDLEEAKNGLLDSAEGSEVLKTAEGQLSYENTNKEEGKGEHILSTPAGGQYNVTLPDGTRVWLNASSSLKYPVLFDGKERIVELTGEGYFEVAHSLTQASPLPPPQNGEGDPSHRRVPFIVKLKGGATVEVLGTHFNVMAYDDEKYVQTTLLEGKVALRFSGKLNAQDDNRYSPKELNPGEQGVREEDGGWRIAGGIDTSEVVAWKNGKFQFKEAKIETVMRQIARWYNAEIVYEGKVDDHFNVTTIYRSEPLSKLLGVLEATNRVHFRIEGKKVMVRP